MPHTTVAIRLTMEDNMGPTILSCAYIEGKNQKKNAVLECATPYFTTAWQLLVYYRITFITFGILRLLYHPAFYYYYYYYTIHTPTAAAHPSHESRTGPAESRNKDIV